MQKTIFITGTSSGLGKATAKLFNSQGWRVIAAMRNSESEAELTKLKNITIVKLDVTNPTEITETIKTVLKNHSVDVIVNNAGYGLVGPLEALTDEQIIKQINTNLLGTIRVTKEFMPHFREKQDGLFINITSMFGLIGYPTCSVYAATKFGVDGFSESLAYEVVHLGINVKTIAPGGIQTDFAGRSLEGGMHEAYHKLGKKVSEGYSEEQISRFSSPENVAKVIYEAATDNKNQLRYLAGNDAIELYNEKTVLGAEEQFKKIKKMFEN
jgi:NAD(P)-dependent dehydrogenase (short-subunit alcohol dehydrogenase family)